MKHLKLTFGDIAERSILYFDQDEIAACHNICETLRIDNMPDYDSEHYYELINEKFNKKRIESENKLNVGDQIFQEGHLEKFKVNKHNVIFIFKGDVLKGIVHFSDYNKTAVLQAIQDDVLTLERKLRQFLFLNNFRNNNIINYLKYRMDNCEKSRAYFEGRINSLQRREYEMNQLGEFQIFDLKDLLDFGNSSQSHKIFKTESVQINDKKIHQITLVNSLRNIAMHGKNPIEKNEETFIYTIESLSLLFQALNNLRILTYRLEKNISEHPDFIKSMQMDNRSKLQIIHQHHPKALNYFIGS